MQQIVLLIIVATVCLSLKIDFQPHLSHSDQNFLQDPSQFDKSKLGHNLLKLHSIQDLPQFIQSGQVYNQQGLKMLTKFLTEDDDVLQRNGGIYDETGFDGLDPNEEQQPFGSELRNRQRARSAANIYQRESAVQTDNHYDAYGCTVDKEKLNDWFIYVVLLMSSTSKHKLMKVCIPQNEDHKIAFVMSTDKKCADVVQYADKFEQKSENYLERTGILGKIQQSQQYQDLIKSKKILTPPGLFTQVQNPQAVDLFKNKKDEEEVVKQKEKLAKLQVFKEIQQQINTLQRTLLNVATEQIQSPSSQKKQDSLTSFIQTNQTNKEQQIIKDSTNSNSNNSVSEVQQLKQEIQSMKQNQENFIKQLMQQFKMSQVQIPAQQSDSKDKKEEPNPQTESKQDQKSDNKPQNNQYSQNQQQQQQQQTDQQQNEENQKTIDVYKQKEKEEKEKIVNIYKEREEKKKREDISLDLADLIKQRIDSK